ncbi:hypothetical protein GCM10022247_36270 [Allokutzneria multivorans]|uniref:Uncharacterized protein n=1 Tax=Allokutzneria multivorans TaxID=1142134 RepID=A0ABP7SF49_9PSEU
MKKRTLAGVLASALIAPLLALGSPAHAAPAGESVQQVPELAASVGLRGRKLNLWALRTPAGDWNWHGHLEYGAGGDEVWTENSWGSVVSRAHVPTGRTSVDTNTWGSKGTFRVCGRVSGQEACSSYATRS